MTDVEHAVEVLRASVLSVIPRRRRIDAVVESGRVTDQIIQLGRVLSIQERTFLYAACGGVLLELTDGLISSEAADILSEVVATSLSGLDLPVALSPSGILSLIEHCAENDDVREEDKEFNSLFSILQKRWSPYPPHCVPKSLQLEGPLGENNCTVHEDRLLPIDAWSYLLIRPDWWSQPFGALPVRLGSVKVSCETITPPPLQVLLLDAVTPLANGTGRRECEAEFSILGKGRREAIGERPVTLLMDVRKVIGSVVSAIGSPRPGRSFNPITGNRFGMAPILLTAIHSGELMESLQ